MAQYYPQQQQPGYAPQGSAQNLQFFPSSYSSVSGHTTPSQASYGAGFGGAPNPSAQAYPGGGYGGFGSPAAGVSGRMGEQSGLRTGWLAAFGAEGYDGEPSLQEELGINLGHIKTKVGRRKWCYLLPGVIQYWIYERSSNRLHAYHLIYMISYLIR
jgi:outer membrane protein insertion porin family